MDTHSVTCHPTQLNAPHLNPSQLAGTWFTYPGRMEGWVDLGYPARHWTETNSQSLDHKSDTLTTTPPSHNTMHVYNNLMTHNSWVSFFDIKVTPEVGLAQCYITGWIPGSNQVLLYNVIWGMLWVKMENVSIIQYMKVLKMPFKIWHLPLKQYTYIQMSAITRWTDWC